MLSARAAARRLAAGSGALALRHRLRNRATLTVAMFHRVTAPGTLAAARADANYAVPAPLFAEVLRFFARHYAVVGLASVQAAQAGGARLPPRALLITFDDGWADNLAVAVPLLRQAGLPAALFVATDALHDPAPWWWQEVLLRALRERRVPFAALWAAAGEPGGVPAAAPELALLQRYAALPAARREKLLAPLLDDVAAEGRHMLRPADLAKLAAAGVAIGAHGAAHLPLSFLADPAADLARSLAALAPLRPTAFSFPHGRYHAASLAATREAGLKLVFTSDACLNAAPGGRPAALLGRIPIDAGAIADAALRLDCARLTTWLFHRPIRRLGPAAGLDPAGALARAAA